MKSINENLYIVSTVVFVLITIGFFLISWMMQRRNLRKVFNTRNIAIVGILSALSIVLTNVLGYSISMGFGPIRLAFGNFIIFIVGMLFGPMFGMVSGVVSDGVGAIINSGGAYHFGFTMAKALFGFAGSLVFIYRTNKWLISKTAFTFALYFLIYSFMISPISVMSIYSSKGMAEVYAVSKLIRTPIELAIYIPLTVLGFEICAQLLQRMISKKEFIWAFRHGMIHFKPKKSMYAKRIGNKDKEVKSLPAPKVQLEEKSRIVNK